MARITVLGAGMMGSALCVPLLDHGNQVRLVGTHLDGEIVQNLQTGILMIYGNGSVRVMNQAATRLLDPERPVPLEQGRSLEEYNEALFGQFQHWQRDGSHLPQPITIADDAPQIIANFRSLSGAGHGDALVFIEDYSPVTRQAQSLKLASLGRLTASIAHEIRNPLGAISNAAQLLGESTDRHADDQRLVQIIGDHARRMNVIVENITQLGRRDRVNQLPLRLAAWIQEFIEQYAEHTKLPAEAISWSGPQDLVMCVDPDQLYQVVVNLCENSLRHCPPFTGGEPLIRLHFGTMEDGKPYLEAIDRGSGIPPDIVENIFDPFFTTTPQGTGLGLYIARELCEGNGGGLEHLPGNEVGARFRATLAKAEECGG